MSLFVFRLFYVDGVFNIMYVPQKGEKKLAKCNKIIKEKYIFWLIVCFHKIYCKNDISFMFLKNISVIKLY